MDDLETRKHQVMLASKFGKAVADALGLKYTRKITITMDYEDFVRINVEALLTAGDGEEFTGYLQKRKYHLVLDDETIPVVAGAVDDGLVETTHMGVQYRQYARLQEPPE